MDGGKPTTITPTPKASTAIERTGSLIQLSKIKPNNWYKTLRGDAQCISADTISRRIRFKMASGKTETMTPADVQFEIHPSEAPTPKEAAVSQGDADLLEAAELARNVYEEILSEGALNQTLAARAEFAKRTLNDAIAHRKGLK